MADAFKHASGMAQSHAGGSVSGKEIADRYVKARPATPKPGFDVLYPPRERCLLHKETKTHVSGGVNRVEYAIVEDSATRVLVVAPFNTSKSAPLRAIFLSLAVVYEALDGLGAKPWRKHDKAADRDRAVAKFVMSRLQYATETEWPQLSDDALAGQMPKAPGARFVPRTGPDAETDGAMEVAQPADFAVDEGDTTVFPTRPLLLADAAVAAGLVAAEPEPPALEPDPPAPAPEPAAPAPEPEPPAEKAAPPAKAAKPTGKVSPAAKPAAKKAAPAKGRGTRRVAPG